MVLIDALVAEFVVPVLVLNAGIKLAFLAEQRLADIEAQLRLAEYLTHRARAACTDEIDKTGELPLHRAEFER